MFFHLDKVNFKGFVRLLSKRIDIGEDLIEKDYYVCLVLKELAENQEYLKAYFKGGTAVYKILDTMNRFSEDIDLTVEVVKEESNNSNRTRLKKSALGYKIEGLILEKEKTKDVKQSVTAFYRYDSCFEDNLNPLHRAGEIQVEATSFTISEPTEIHEIEPIIYKFSNEYEKEILSREFDIKPFNIKTQKLERIFVDKLFTTELCIEKMMYIDLAKHLYDITILFRIKRVQEFFENPKEFQRIVNYKRLEETHRKGGVSEFVKFIEFRCFELNFDEEMRKVFKLMQEKYIFKREYQVSLEEVRGTLKEIRNKIMLLNVN